MTFWIRVHTLEKVVHMSWCEWGAIKKTTKISYMWFDVSVHDALRVTEIQSLAKECWKKEYLKEVWVK